jgi:hypothetical protein
LLRAAIGPDPLGTTLAPDQPLLLIASAGSGHQKPQSRPRLGFLLDSTPPGTGFLFIQFLLEGHAID